MGTARSGQWRDAGRIVVLLVISGAVKGWLLFHTEVPAKDGIGFIQYAARLRQEPWGQVLRQTQQHPLYPIHIRVTAELVEAVAGETSSTTWQLSAQLPNALAGILLVVPLYLLGREVFGRRVGFWAALLFQVLPVPARVTADALSEGVYLFWSAVALWAAVRGLRTRAPGWFALAGVAGGLAYLTRPEGALVVCAAGFLAVALRVLGAWPVGWVRGFACGSCLAVATLATVLPYWLTIGGLSVKPSFHNVLQADAGRSEGAPTGGSPTLLLASRFTPGVDGKEWGEVSVWFALYEVVDEVCKGFHYVLWVPALVGVWWFRRRLRTSPGFALLVFLGLLHLLVLWRLAVVNHYVSERHTVLLVLCGTIVAAAALFEAAERWPAKKRPDDEEPMPSAAAPRRRAAALLFDAVRRPRVVVGVVLVLLVGAGLVKTLRTMHGHRAGHRLAGLWFAAHARPGDQLVDPYGWALFYAERTPIIFPPADSAPSASANRYLVVEPHDRDTRRQQIIQEASAGVGAGEPVLSWPQEASPRLVLYVAPVR